jgi:hypothetical protein
MSMARDPGPLAWRRGTMNAIEDEANEHDEHQRRHGQGTPR